MRSNALSNWLTGLRSRNVAKPRRSVLGVQQLQDRLVPATIMGYSFADLNNNGVRDCSEPGVSGATVFLTGKTSCGQTVCETTKTDCQGNYTFDNLAPGDYIVGECAPAGSKGVNASVGEAGGYAVGGVVVCVHLTDPCQYVCGYNFGVVPACNQNGSNGKGSGGKGSHGKCSTGSHGKGSGGKGSGGKGSQVKCSTGSNAKGSGGKGSGAKGSGGKGSGAKQSHDACSTGSHGKGSGNKGSNAKGSGGKGSGGKGSHDMCSTGSHGKASQNKGSNNKGSGCKGSNGKGSHDLCNTNQSHGKGSNAKGSHAKGSAGKGSAVKC